MICGKKVNEQRNAFVYFLMTCGLSLLLIWSVPHFPSQDGPWHLENASIIKSYFMGDFAPFKSVYRFQYTQLTNCFTHFFLAGLLKGFSPPVSDKILVTLYVISFLSFWFLFFAPKGTRSPLSLFAFSFAFNYFLHLGSYNFCFSLVLFLASVGYWYPRRTAPTHRRVLVLGLLLFIQFALHPLPVLFFMALLGAFSLGEFTRYRFSVLRWCLSALPIILLVVLFVRSNGGDTVWDFTSFAKNLRNVLFIDSLFSFHYWEKLITLSIFFIVLFASGRVAYLQWKRKKPKDLLLPVSALLFFIIYFLSPSRVAAGGMVPARVLLFPFLMLLAWLCRCGVGDNVWGRCLCGLLLIAQFVSHEFNYLRINDTLDNLVEEIPRMEPGKILLPVNYAYWGTMEHSLPLSQRIAPFTHLGGILAYRDGVIDLDNGMAESTIFPVVFQSGLVPSHQLGGGTYGYPPHVDIEQFESQTGRAIDYVVVWGFPKFLEKDPSVIRLRSQLEKNYQLRTTAVDPETGPLMFERRPVPVSVPEAG